MSVVRLPRSMSTELGSGRKATRAVSPDTQPSLFDEVIRVFGEPSRVVTRLASAVRSRPANRRHACAAPVPGRAGAGDAAYQRPMCSASASGRRAAGLKVSPLIGEPEQAGDFRLVSQVQCGPGGTQAPGPAGQHLAPRGGQQR